jgi:hypothetical protein
MLEPFDPLPASPGDSPSLTERLTNHPGLAQLVAEAESTWLARAQASGEPTSRPGWRTFEDAFPTFYEFTNRPK